MASLYDEDDDGAKEFSPEESSALNIVRVPSRKNLTSPTAGRSVFGEGSNRTPFEDEVLKSKKEEGGTTPSGQDDSNTRDGQTTVREGSRSGSITDIKPKSSDFLFGKFLGEGSFARVVYARLKNTTTDYAVKILEKMHVRKENKLKNVVTEKNVLIKCSHPMILKLYFCFTDVEYIYMCMDLCPGGELAFLIEREKSKREAEGKEDEACSLEVAKFYTAEISEALEYLHGHEIIHRDLKPENVLLSSNGHIKLGDFGSALMMGEIDEDQSFEGTPLYVSPEVLNGETITHAVDLWALGCITFHMLYGRTPFSAETEFLIFENITGYSKGEGVIPFPENADSAAKSLIESLLNPVASERLGSGLSTGDHTYGHLKGHDFFEGLSWGQLLEQDAPYVPDPATFPSEDSLTDGANADWVFGGEATVILDNTSNPRNISVEPIHEDDSVEDEWMKFLDMGEQPLFRGITQKRKGLFSKKRLLVLTDKPRLLYVDPSTSEVKGEIPWTVDKPVSAVKVTDMKFDIFCAHTGRTYHFTADEEQGSKVWTDFIDAMVEKQAEEYKAKQKLLEVYMNEKG